MTEVADLVREDGSVDARQLNSGRSHPRISAATCAAMRAAVDDDTTHYAVADEFEVSEKTVRYHINGECSHDEP